MQAINICRKLSLLAYVVLIIQTAYSQDYRSNSRRHRVETPDTTGLAEGAINARTIYGTVQSLSDDEYLTLASITEVGTKNIVYSNEQGVFSIKLNLTKKNILACSYIGFESDTAIVDENSNYIRFKLKQKFEVIKEVVVSASRKNERKFESPVTIETLDPKQIQYNTSLSMYDQMLNLAGVDAIATSINFKVLNTRGFNSAYNRRFVQKFDNIDLAMPGFNIALGQLNGPIDLDIEKVELIPGSSSALYGPNALNGLMNTTSKNPFKYRGLSFCSKLGVNHVDGIDATPSPLYDINIRYADLINKKLAYKFTLGYYAGTDWKATDYRDASDYSYTNNLTTYGYKPGLKNPGYDGLNTGGDEVSNIFDSANSTFPTKFGPITLINKPLKISRTGYLENQMFNYKSYNLKSDIAFFYRPNKYSEISWTSRFANGNTNFLTENRTQIKNFFIQNHKVEVKVRNHVFRSYVSMEDNGVTFDLNLTGVLINRAAKPDANWFVQYLLAYSGYYNMLTGDSIKVGDDAAARKIADGDNSKLYNQILQGADSTLANLILGQSRLIAGSKEYDSVFKQVTLHKISEGGSQFNSLSKIWYTEYIYDFKDIIKKFSLLAGANYKLYAPLSLGSIFSDAEHRIYINEFGGFVQVSKELMNRRLKLQASARLDKMDRFYLKFSPRASVNYSLGEKRNQNIRVSAQIGYRMPALYDQYVSILIPPFFNYGGFYQTSADLKLVRKNADGTDFVNMYIENSVKAYKNSGDPSQLRKPVIKDIKPEEIRAVEIGWRSFLFKKLETDVNIYINKYTNLISAQQFIALANKDDTISPYNLYPQNTQIYRRSVNSEIPISCVGFTFAFNYFLSKKYTFTGNYNYNSLINPSAFLAQDFISGFNTPKNKLNLGITGIKVWKQFGFCTNFRWVDQYDFREFSHFGKVPAYYSLDLMLSYHLPKYNTMLKLGGSNITNNRYSQAVGGPTIGALYYFSILYDDLLK